MMDLLGDWRLQLDIVGSVVFAMLLGGLIGYERETRKRPAHICWWPARRPCCWVSAI